jgi:C1A family cysteine protease
MYSLLLLVSLSCLVTVYHQALSAPTDQTCEEIKQKIRNANAKWTPNCATSKRTFQGKRAYGALPEKQTRTFNPPPKNRKIPQKPNQSAARSTGLPQSFSTREVWRSKCPRVDHVLDQGGCGNCWAAASISVINDRICMYSADGAPNKFLSWKQLTKCIPNGCNGGRASNAFNYWQTYGLTTGAGNPYLNQPEGCLPYPESGLPDTVTGQQCPASCDDGANIAEKSRGGQPYQIQPKNETAIMEEIYYYGSAATRFDVYEDFNEYSGYGIYKHAFGADTGFGHAVKLIGWGVEEDGDKYWLIQNSWGPTWGEFGLGLFKFDRGTDNVGIESTVYAAIPEEA